MFKSNKSKTANTVSTSDTFDTADISNTADTSNAANSEEPKPKKPGFFKKILSGLEKTKNNIMTGVDNVMKSFVKIDAEFFEELEEILIMADIGAETSHRIIKTLEDRVRSEKASDPAVIKDMLADVISRILDENGEPAAINAHKPTIVLVIGVNGVGKTTTIGKLAHNFTSSGDKVVLAAGDTFRAAAIDQLEIWAKRSGADFIRQQEGSDPGAVVFDAIAASKARKADVLICDTAGRLHNKKNLMDELKKIFKIVSQNYSEAHLEVLLVLDATTGQNALQQARIFKEAVGVTGIALTKLDSTAKGGIVIAIVNELKIPVRYIGVGEGIDDLQEFDSAMFARALFGGGDENE